MWSRETHNQATQPATTHHTLRNPQLDNTTGNHAPQPAKPTYLERPPLPSLPFSSAGSVVNGCVLCLFLVTNVIVRIRLAGWGALQRRRHVNGGPDSHYAHLVHRHVVLVQPREDCETRFVLRALASVSALALPGCCVLVDIVDLCELITA